MPYTYATAGGSRSITAIKVEAAFNTDPTSPTPVPVISNSVQQTESAPTPQFVLTGEPDAYQVSQGTELWAGDVVVPFESDLLPTWLNILFGTVTPPNPWNSHDFQTSFTMYRQYEDIARKDVFTGCMITRMGLDWSAGQPPLALTFGVVAAKNTPAASAALTVPSYTKPLHWSEATLTWGGSGYTKATRISLSCDFAIDTSAIVFGTATGQRAAFPIGNTNVTGEITALFDGADLESYANVERALVITLTGAAGQGTWVITMAKTKCGKPRYSCQGPGAVLATVPFTAYKTAAAANALGITYTAP